MRPFSPDNFIRNGRRNEMMRGHKNDPCNVIRVYGYVKSTEPFRFRSIVYKASREPIYRNTTVQGFFFYFRKNISRRVFISINSFFKQIYFLQYPFRLNNSEKNYP